MTKPASLLFLGAFLASSGFSAGLERIDAVGVTEVGGSPTYAGMLPRTGSSGKLDASLLPAMGEWAASPLPGAYFVASSAGSGGNGSLQYPFNSINRAVAQAGVGSALLLAPGGYSGDIPLQAGRTLSIFGLGAHTTLPELRVTAAGTSQDTTLSLTGVSVGSIVVTGGTVKIRLTDTVVQQLSGDGAVTVERCGMGAAVLVSSMAYTDGYSGHATAPYSRAVTDNGLTLTLQGGRARVNSSQVAYMSDISSAVSAIGATTAAQASSVEQLSQRIAAEEQARVSATNALAAALRAEIGAVGSNIGTIGDGWNTQLSTLVGWINAARADLTALDTREAASTAALTGSIAAVPYAAADSVLEARVRDAISTQCAAVRAEMPGVVNTAVDGNYVKLVTPSSGTQKGVTIGSRAGTVGPASLAQGTGSRASGTGGVALGNRASDGGYAYSFVWSPSEYTSKGGSTFCINPAGGTSGFYIGNTSLAALLAAKADKGATTSALSLPGPSTVATNVTDGGYRRIEPYIENGSVKWRVAK